CRAFGRYSARRRSLTNAAAAPSNSGNVQINAVAIKKSDNTSHACSNQDLVTRLVNASLECVAIRSGRALSNTAGCMLEAYRLCAAFDVLECTPPQAPRHGGPPAEVLRIRARAPLSTARND